MDRESSEREFCNRILLKDGVIGRPSARLIAPSCCDQSFRFNGARRPTKMGNIVSPWRYDAGACCTLQSTKLRWTTIWHFAFAAAHPQYLDPLARDCADRVVPISVAPQLCHALGVPPGQTGA